MQRVSHQPAFILHTRAFQDSSLICECFTPEYGRIAGIARGARRPKSKTKGLLQPFSPLLLSWQGRNELVTLTKIEAQGLPTGLSHLGLLSGLYLNELLMRLLHKNDPHPEVFSHYAATLPKLNDRSQRDISLRIFEMQCLADIGYGLPLQPFLQNEPMPSSHYHYDNQRGFVACQPSAEDGYAASALQAIARQQFDEPAVRQACKQLMRQALAARLGNKPLKTRELLQPLTLET